MNQLSCQKCGGNVIKTYSSINGKSELGFTIPISIYECEKCHEKHIICPKCEGDGYMDAFGLQDCDKCYGMGVIELKRITNNA